VAVMVAAAVASVFFVIAFAFLGRRDMHHE
jgi:hypothetical protein